MAIQESPVPTGAASAAGWINILPNTATKAASTTINAAQVQTPLGASGSSEGCAFAPKGEAGSVVGLGLLLGVGLGLLI